MSDGEASLPHPGLAEAERRVRAAIAGAQSAGDSSALAMRHAELGVILGALGRHQESAVAYRTSLGYLDLLQADGSHEEQRLLRMTSPSAPPPQAGDYDLRRLTAEVRVALVESLVAAGDHVAANAELQAAAPLTTGFTRRRLRRRLEQAGAAIVAASGQQGRDITELQHHLSRASNPEQQRALRLQIANSHLDSGRLAEAVREALLLVRSADQVGDPLVRAGARQVLGLALEGQGQHSEALPILFDAFRDLQDHGDPAGVVGMGEALAQRLVTAGDSDRAVEVLRGTQHSAARSGDVSAEVSAATMLGAVLDTAGDRGAAVEVLNDAATRAAAAGLATARADALHSAAVTLGQSTSPDDLVESLSLLDEAKRIYREYGLLDRVAGCEHEAGAMLGRNGSHDAAVGRYREALAIYDELPPELRDAGPWPDEVADCRANLRWLEGERSGSGGFRSGGHSMTHPQV